jgi:glycosyltransferase involved in cell wall biosynthesis
MGGIRLSGLVIAKDEAARIRACLDSLAFCDEIVLVDSGSTDGTRDIARAAGAQVVERPFTSYNEQKEHGRTLVRGRWVLNLDADEVASPELQDEIALVLESAGLAGYRIPFRNHFRGVWVRRSGYYPDRHLRLFQRDLARWDPAYPVHERLLVDGAVGRLEGHIDHYSFESISDFLDKSCRYAARFAERAHADGRRAGLFTIGAHTAARFFKAFVLEGGFLEGSLGLTISGLQAYEVFQKYARLWELGRFSPKSG